jgi:hypothetical protein
MKFFNFDSLCVCLIANAVVFSASAEVLAPKSPGGPAIVKKPQNKDKMILVPTPTETPKRVSETPKDAFVKTPRPHADAPMAQSPKSNVDERSVYPKRTPCVSNLPGDSKGCQ